MKTRRIAVAIIALALLLALVASFAACGSSTSSSSSPSASGPRASGTLTVTFQGEPTELDPAIAWEVESWSIERLTYQTFLTYASKSGEAGTQLVPDLATEVPTAANGGISADGKVYTFHIKKGIKFAPPISTEVTAADFKWSFQRMMKAPLAPATFFYTGIVGAQDYIDGKAGAISGFKVVDPYTVQITIAKPDASFLYAMTMPFTSVMSRAWCAKVGKQIKRKPLGTGPYTITDWTSGQSIDAVKNPNFSSQGVQGQQYVDNMHFIFSANPGTALLKLERGEVDVLGDSVPPADYLRTKQSPEWGKYVVDSPQIMWFYTFMNVLEKPFDNVKVRQAINYAIDTQKIQKLLAGQATSLNQIYPKGMPGHQDGKTYYTYDPAKAKQLLAEAGFPNGFKTTFYADNVDPMPKLAQSVQSDLAAIGITASLKIMDRATYWDFISLKKSHAGIGFSDWYMDFPDPSDWIGPLFTNPIDGGANASFYENPQVTKLFNDSGSQLDPAKRLQMFQQMQDIIMQDAPTAPMYQAVWNGMYGKNTGGYYIHPVWIFNFQEYWKTNG
ncbi:MAG TPA: ABC transporter substrate-binding protein [Thermoleophilia bacterium]|nr:ABC transporter substrate-binding protein [Thermoleophilia bacterium]